MNHSTNGQKLLREQNKSQIWNQYALRPKTAMFLTKSTTILEFRERLAYPWYAS